MGANDHLGRRLSFFQDWTADSVTDHPRGPVDSAPHRRGRLARRTALGITVAATGVAVGITLPGGSASADPTATDWSRLRNCESSNNYVINTGNNHYGAYQFDLQTWRSVGGTGYPNLASPAEQDARALILYRMRGWQPWQCAGIVGLREDSSARSGLISDIAIGATISAGAAPAAPAGAPPDGVPSFPGPQYFHYGDQSPTIKQFQDQMHARGYFPIGTGDYGPNTQAMVTRLQSLNGLIPNGEIGPNTWRLAWTGTYSPAPTDTPVVAAAPAPSTGSGAAPAWPGPQYFSYGDHSPTIKQFQDQMHARGYFPVGTGDFGPNTLAMLNRLQGQNGLPQTGLLGPVTWNLAWTGTYHD